VSPDEIAEATGLELRSPERLQLAIHPSLAGRIPVLTTDDRDDFVTLVQALSMRNEPRPIPASMGASTVKGFNNWGRIAAYRRAWEAADPLNRLPGAWTAEFRQLIPRRELYEDSFILLCDGPYSNVAASELGMTTDEWRIVSLVVRAEHECTHYLTLRLFGTTRNNILDEVLADYTGIAMAGGRFKGEWLLRAVGLEDFPRYREGGRLQNYLGDPPLSPGAFVVLQRLVHAAAGHLEEFDGRFRDEDAGRRRDPLRRGVALLSAIQFTLEELAAPAAVGRLNAAADELTEAVQHVG
jgi:hypothetical protein